MKHIYLSLGIALMALSGTLCAKINIAGKTYFSAPEVSNLLGMQFKWEIPKAKASLSRGNATLELQKEKRVCKINNIQIWLGDPICLRRNHLYISQKDLNGSIGPILTPKLLKKSKCHHIILDPGHGGKDHGTSNSNFNMREKDLALDLAYRTKDILISQGYKVSMTRKNDTFISLKERPNLAERWGGDLFVSLHFNSVIKGKESVKGTETYVLTQQYHPSTANGKISPNDKKIYSGNKFNANNTLLGYCIQNSLCKHLKVQDRGLKRARFAVLKGLNCPGILVEAGFLSNSLECKKIRSSLYREKLAKCIAKGIIDYNRVINHIKS